MLCSCASRFEHNNNYCWFDLIESIADKHHFNSFEVYKQQWRYTFWVEITLIYRSSWIFDKPELTFAKTGDRWLTVKFLLDLYSLNEGCPRTCYMKILFIFRCYVRNRKCWFMQSAIFRVIFTQLLPFRLQFSIQKEKILYMNCLIDTPTPLKADDIYEQARPNDVRSVKRIV